MWRRDAPSMQSCRFLPRATKLERLNRPLFVTGRPVGPLNCFRVKSCLSETKRSRATLKRPAFSSHASRLMPSLGLRCLVQCWCEFVLSTLRSWPAACPNPYLPCFTCCDAFSPFCRDQSAVFSSHAYSRSFAVGSLDVVTWTALPRTMLVRIRVVDPSLMPRSLAEPVILWSNLCFLTC